MLEQSRQNQAVAPVLRWIYISVLSTFSCNYFDIFCIFFFVAATSNLVHSVFAGVTNTPDCSGNDELFFFHIGSNLQSPEKLVCDDSFISVCIPCMIVHVGQVSSVGIATRYGLDGLGIESRWGRDFPHLSRLALGPTQPPIQRVPGLSRG